MTWNLTGDRPIWLQLMEKLQLGIVTGEYQAGERLPSVRELAAEAAVNPNTMQKALTELERSGLLYAQRTAGRFVTENRELIQQTREALAEGEVLAFLTRMEGLGFTREETAGLVLRQAGGQSGRTESKEAMGNE